MSYQFCHAANPEHSIVINFAARGVVEDLVTAGIEVNVFLGVSSSEHKSRESILRRHIRLFEIDWRMILSVVYHTRKGVRTTRSSKAALPLSVRVTMVKMGDQNLRELQSKRWVEPRCGCA